MHQGLLHLHNDFIALIPMAILPHGSKLPLLGRALFATLLLLLKTVKRVCRLKFSRRLAIVLFLLAHLTRCHAPLLLVLRLGIGVVNQGIDQKRRKLIILGNRDVRLIDVLNNWLYLCFARCSGHLSTGTSHYLILADCFGIFLSVWANVCFIFNG
jgi:hypothetical protein